MKGADEYANLFKTGQHGRLYFVSSYHARGLTFGVYLLPKGEKAIPNGIHNPPRNSDAIEIYGVISGEPGWTESYGWLHQGPWIDDFNKIVETRKKELAEDIEKQEQLSENAKNAKSKRVKNLLADYP